MIADEAWECYVVDTDSENEPVAAFLDKGMADDYAQWLNVVALMGASSTE